MTEVAAIAIFQRYYMLYTGTDGTPVDYLYSRHNGVT